MPFSSPLSSTNWSGGRVGLIDMTSVPALMMLGGAILGCAWARPGARQRREHPPQQAAAANLIFVMSKPPIGPPTRCKVDAEPRPCPGSIQATPHQPTITADATFTARR